ncbi:hypothetical protein L0F63_004683 [Massospora cicadina]|nr:hypothetical protein L0F63_004683 [Massospora cicadina]
MRSLVALMLTGIVVTESERYYAEGGPAILYLGGESQLSYKVMITGEAQRLARILNASLFALEHRYYGKSQPTQDWKLENLQYLTSELALKDIAHFITTMRKPNQKWVVVGGSYAGNLAAWVRGEYPSLVHAALASSAPVIATEDFSSYDTMIAKALGPICSKAASHVSQIIDAAIDDSNRTKIEAIKSEFKCSRVSNDLEFVSVLSDAISSAVQYHRPETKFNINTVCDRMPHIDDEPALLAHMANVIKSYFDSQNKTCKEATLFAPHKNPLRSRKLTKKWVYESSCSVTIYGSLIGPPNLQIPNRRLSNLPGSKVIYTNGGLDPWSKLSLLAPKLNSTTLHILIENASHTQDLLAASRADHLELKRARETVATTLRNWLI